MRLLAVCAGVLVPASVANAESIHLYSYDPADRPTREAAGPLTFTFRKGLLHNTLLNLRSTEATASADLRPVDEKDLGPGGLRRLAGASDTARDLYRIQPDGDGAALAAALCGEGASAWMAFSPLRLNRELTVLVIGRTAGGPAKLCRSLSFVFHGEWVLPPGRSLDPRDLDRPRFPGG